jgi:predicted O-methyltransferase YrrM
MNINKELLNQTKGFLDLDEGRSLYEYALCASKMGPCLEIGSYCGKSALYLGCGCKENGAVLFSIDHHSGSEEHQPGEGYFDPELFSSDLYQVDTFTHFRRTIYRANLDATVVPIICASEVAARMWSTPLALVFIDGGHAYETVFTDYICWNRHVMKGGYLLIHDIYPNPDDGGQAPYQIYQMALNSGEFKALPIQKSLGILQRL